jgi:serine O-acetyltransferase
MKNILKLLRTDLIQAKIIKESSSFNFFILLYLFLSSKTCRIHFFVRLRSSNFLLSLLAKLYLDQFLIEIGQNTKIGKYFFMPHPRCIIIANNVVIGEHVHISQYVTIGGNFKKIKKLKNGEFQKLPIISNYVNIHPSAVIGGPVTIYEHVIVGANSVITKDVPSNSIVYGQNKLADKKIEVSIEGGSFTIL